MIVLTVRWYLRFALSHRDVEELLPGEAASDARAQQDRSAKIVIAGHGFVQKLRQGHDELAVEEPVARRLAVAFHELALTI